MERNPRPLILALAGALGAALLTIAFLVGRLTAAPPTITATTPVPGTPPAPASAALEDGSRTPTAALPPLPNDVETALPAATADAPASNLDIPPPPTVVASASSPSSSTISPEAAQVAAYFKQVDELQDMGVGDPQAFAASMLKSVSSGDFSAFDDLLGKARAQRQRLQSMTPPRACGEYHRQALTLSADSVTMLERLKAALMKGDSMALMSIATEGRALETQANQLKTLGETVKRQAGL